MSECFSGVAEGVASGTDKTALNLFNPVAAPTSRARIYDILMGCSITPADQTAKFHLGRTTALGTEGSGFLPNNIDPGGPAGECDFGVGHSVEPTYTASKQLLVMACHQRATMRWVTNPETGIRSAAVQNNGLGWRSKSSTSTQGYDTTIFFGE